MIAAAQRKSTAKLAAKSPPKSSRKRTLDYTRRHVVVALLAVGRSRAQAAKYVRISPEMLQRVAECNSRFRYDMRKAELDYQTRKARRRLNRSLVDHTSPDAIEVKAAEEQRAARAEARARAEAAAQAEKTAERIKASLQNDGEAWLLENPEGRSIFYNRELPDLAELEQLAKLFPPLPPLPEFDSPKVAVDLPKVDFDALSEIGEPSPSQSREPLATASELCSESHPESLVRSPEHLTSSPEPLAPSPALDSSFKEVLENKALARVRAQKTWQYFESRRKYRRVRIVATPKQRPINQRLRNAPNPKRPEIKLVVCGLPSPQPSPSGRGSSEHQLEIEQSTRSDRKSRTSYSQPGEPHNFEKRKVRRRRARLVRVRLSRPRRADASRKQHADFGKLTRGAISGVAAKSKRCAARSASRCYDSASLASSPQPLTHSVRNQLADEIDLRLAAPFEPLGGQVLADVSQPFLRPVGVFEVVPLLQDRAMFRDAAEGAGAGCLAGEPVAVVLAVDEIELRVAVPLDPHDARRDAGVAADRDEQRAELFAVAGTVVQGGECAFELAFFVLDLLADAVVDCFDLGPTFEIAAKLFGERTHLGVTRLDERTLAQVDDHVAIDLLGDRVDARVVRRQERAALDLEGDQRLRLLTGRERRDVHDHLLHTAGDGAIVDLLDVRRDVFFDDFDLLLGPVGRDGRGADDAFAGTAACGDRHADLDALGERLVELGAFGVGRFELGGSGAVQPDRQRAREQKQRDSHEKHPLQLVKMLPCRNSVRCVRTPVCSTSASTADCIYDPF